MQPAALALQLSRLTLITVCFHSQVFSFTYMHIFTASQDSSGDVRRLKLSWLAVLAMRWAVKTVSWCTPFPKMKRVISFLAALGKTQTKLMRVWLKNSANMCVYTTLHSISKTARWLQLPNKNVPQIWSVFLGYGWIRIRVTHLSLMSPLHLQRAQVQTRFARPLLQRLLEVAQLSQSWRRRSGCSQSSPRLNVAPD